MAQPRGSSEYILSLGFASTMGGAVNGPDDPQTEEPQGPDPAGPPSDGDWRRQAGVFARRSLENSDPTGWFDALYASAVAGEVSMPWDRDQANPVLVGWAGERHVTGARQRALIVGAGMGRDAEFVAGLGFDTVAFDVSPTAVETVRSRHPRSSVDYLVANLLEPPAEWTRAFDLVVEIYTVQAMPRPVRAQAIGNVADMVGPGGTLLVIQVVQPDDVPEPAGPPWPLTRAEIEAFGTPHQPDDDRGLELVELTTAAGELGPQWRAEFRRRR